MSGRYTRLPPLNALRSFEAAARHLSFAAAAEELSLTPSAISHQIRALETHLGLKLFLRLNPGLALTEDGRQMLRGVEAGFLALVEATDRAKARTQRRIITVAAPSPVAFYWLLPRLPAFAARHPEIEPHAVSFDSGEPFFARDQLDLAILKRRVDGFKLGPHEAFLMRDWVFPVCSPALATNERPLSEAPHLARHTLIQEDQQTSPDIDWQVWIRNLGVAAKRQAALVRYSDFTMAMQAAIDGQGVALGRSPLVDREIAAGRLRRPLPDRAVAASRAYILRWPDSAKDDAPVMALRDHLLAEAAGTGAPLDA